MMWEVIVSVKEVFERLALLNYFLDTSFLSFLVLLNFVAPVAVGVGEESFLVGERENRLQLLDKFFFEVILDF